MRLEGQLGLCGRRGALGPVSVSVAVGSDFDGDYADSNELSLALAESATVRSCFARHVFRASAGTNGSVTTKQLPARPSRPRHVSPGRPLPGRCAGAG